MRFLHGLKILTVIRLLAAVIVISVVGFTAALAYHVHVEPIGGKLSKLIPEPGSINPHAEAITYARSLEQRELPDIEPGAQAFRKAQEMMAAGQVDEAREKLTTIFNIFPNSSVAIHARQIVGEMNLDDLLGSKSGFGRSIHKVRPGDSYLAIAAKHRTTIAMMIHLNSMSHLKGIQPGHEIVVMPLNFRLLIDQRRQAVSIWDGGRFLHEYPALFMKGLPSGGSKTRIKHKLAKLNGGNVASHDEAYCGADKIIQLDADSLQITAWNKPIEQMSEQDQEALPHGIFMKPQHLEELALLTRSGNTVEIR